MREITYREAVAEARDTITPSLDSSTEDDIFDDLESVFDDVGEEDKNFLNAFLGDGCLMEGISHEAMTFAAHHKLNKLIYLWDDNSITIDGDTSVSTSEDQIARFKAVGWHTESVDGHNVEQIKAATEGNLAI